MKILMTAILLSGGFSPLAAGSFADLSSQAPASEIKLSTPVPAPAQDKAAQSWAEAAKTAFEREIEAGGLTNFADLKELPPGARARLENELATLPEGPGNTSEAFKLNVNGRTAFVVQSYVHDDTMRAWLFNAAGVLVARGEGSVDKPFAWLPL